MVVQRVVVNKDLLKIKDLVCRRERVLADTGGENQGMHLRDIHRRVSSLESKLRVKESRSATVFRRKKQIAYVVKKHGNVSSSLVAKELNISRNRANEYLKDMERAGLLTSTKKGKIVFYRGKA